VPVDDDADADAAGPVAGPAAMPAGVADGERVSAEATGDLTIHGVTQRVTFDAELQGVEQDPWGNERFAVEVTGVTPKAVWVRVVDQGIEGRLVRETASLGTGDRISATLLQADPEKGYIAFAREIEKI
jgi:hypothetical protein